MFTQEKNTFNKGCSHPQDKRMTFYTIPAQISLSGIQNMACDSDTCAPSKMLPKFPYFGYNSLQLMKKWE
jgi:hypothetical protein